MRIERAEGDKDPVRSLSPIHPLCLARSIFLRLSLSLSSLPFPRQYHRFFETDVLTYTSYIRPCASIRFFLDSHILLVGIEEPRQDNETTRRAKCRDISRGVEVRRKKGILLHRIRVSSRYRACSAYRSFIMGIKYVRGPSFSSFLSSFPYRFVFPLVSPLSFDRSHLRLRPCKSENRGSIRGDPRPPAPMTNAASSPPIF